MIANSPEGLFVRDDDDEGLFSRNFNGQLVRVDSPTSGDYDKEVTVQIDGQPVTVPLAVPLADASGNIIQDKEGKTTPRYTTIYDAALKLYVKTPGDEAKIPIPVLCHQPHMQPVAVCRLCVVQIYGEKRGKRAAERKLLPACQHPVKPGMEVFTMNDPGRDGDRVRQTVKTLTELLSADHLKLAPAPAPAKELHRFNELGQAAERCGAILDRFQSESFSQPAPASEPLRGRRNLDTTSPVFLVDHSACILCDRCVRACTDVKENNIIGRTGKGATAGIGFDLNAFMGQSGCVQCGECMVSCPTSAITFKPIAKLKTPRFGRSSKVLTIDELRADPLFSAVPPKFLLWQQGLVLRRKIRAGDILCHQGDPGNTAFLIKSGNLQAVVAKSAPLQKQGVFAKVLQAVTPSLRFTVTPEQMIIGEMACLTGSPRNAEILALTKGEVWEIRRNVLDRLMRLPSLRERLDSEYRRRSLDLALNSSYLFRRLPKTEEREVADFIRERIDFVRLKSGQTLFRQNDPGDDIYIIRFGHVRVAVGRFDNEAKVTSIGAGNIIGEIGLLGFTVGDTSRDLNEIDRKLKSALDEANDIPGGFRSATCTALDNLELARLNREHALEMIRRFPTVRRRIIERSLGLLKTDALSDSYPEEFVEQGLYEGQSILVIDMDCCTGCDECTKGCVQNHGTHSHGAPITRMLRDGARFGDYTIGTACRSCTVPHCMSGCPVDSIHRGKHLQIVIEDHCIGCGLCANNCPYGSIFMIPNEKRRVKMPDPQRPGRQRKVSLPKAAACDLCDSEGHHSSPDPACVRVCPHDAAHRMTGEELLRKVLGKK